MEYVRKIYHGKILENARVAGMEVDILLPELRLGIEYDGLYYHSTLKVKPDYHIEKLKIINKAGYRLINIFEDEWHDHIDNVKEFLKSAISGNMTISQYSAYYSNAQIRLGSGELYQDFRWLDFTQKSLFADDYIEKEMVSPLKFICYDSHRDIASHGKKREFEVYDCGGIIWKHK